MEYTSYKQRLRPSILAEADRRFRLYGIKAVKMDDIAKALTISKRTLYELYSTKELLLLEVLKQGHERRINHMREVAENCDNTMDLLIEALRLQMKNAAVTHADFYSDIEAYPKAQKQLQQFFETQHEASKEFFRKGIEEGYFLADIDFEITEQIISEVMRMIRTNKEFKALSYKELFMNFLYMLIRGFCTFEGIKRIDAFVDKNVK